MSTFIIPFIAILKLFLVSLAGYILFRINLIKKFYNYLLFYVVDIGLPILIIGRMTLKLNYSNLNKYLFVLIAGAIIVIAGFLIGLLTANIFKIEKEYKSIFISLMTFTNMGYLPIPLFQAIFKGSDIIQAQLYVFLIIIPFHLFLWSIGVPLVLNRPFKLKELKFKFTSPFVAVLIGLIIPIFKVNPSALKPILPYFNFITESLNPLIMLMLGGAFANMNLSNIKFDRHVFLVVLAKLIIVPGIAFLIIINLNISLILKIFLIVEFAVPPAVNIVIINKRYGGTEKNLKFILSSMVFSYLLIILTLPFFLALINLFTK